MLSFSPEGDWLVGRQFFCPLITWHLTDPSMTTGIISAGLKPLRSGSDRAPYIKFSRDGNSVAGLANDQRLYLWRPTTPPGYESVPLFPGGYSGDSNPSVDFSVDNKYVAAIAPDGGVYVWEVESKIDLTNPSARHYARAAVKFSQDNSSLVTYDMRNVSFGNIGTQLDHVLTNDSNISNIVVINHGKELVVFAENNISLIRRKLYFWGIPLWDYGWPPLTGLAKLQKRRLEGI